MRLNLQTSTASFLTPTLLLALVVACVLFGQPASTLMSMESMRNGMTAMQCCSLQQSPDIHAAIAQTAIPDTARALLTIVGATAAFIFGVGAVGLQQKDTLVRLLLHRFLARHKDGGFLRAMRRGIIHPRLYEPVVVFV